MIRSMYSGVSGLRAHQTAVDVAGNNIANVNTVGFKSQATVFADVLYDLQQAASRNGAGDGGVNPSQVGLGTKVARINQNMSAGALQRTGRSTDVAIEGDGFIAVSQRSGEILYTRAGSLDIDARGNLVTPDGRIVQGYPAPGGVVDTTRPVENLRLPIEGVIAPQATQTIKVGGNLNISGSGQSVSRVNVVDAQGRTVPVTISMTNTGPNTWDYTVEALDPATNTPSNVATGTLNFDPATGRPTIGDITLTGMPGTFNGDVTIDLGVDAPDGITQFDGIESFSVLSQDGVSTSPLVGFSISANGDVLGLTTTRESMVLGRIAMATFANASGLERVGSSSFRATVNSGDPIYSTPGQGGGVLISGVVEASNVDLSEQFTNLILAQRGYQANARMITTSDEILTEVVNLKR